MNKKLYLIDTILTKQSKGQCDEDIFNAFLRENQGTRMTISPPYNRKDGAM